MIIYQIAYIIAVILLAAINANIIKEGRKIWHFGNGLLHITAAGFLSAIWWWPLGFALLANTRVFFDCSLNLMRGLPLNYQSINPASWIDKQERKFFGNEFYLAKLSCLVFSLTLNVLYFVFIKT